MTPTGHDLAALLDLDARVRTLLPPEYQDSYQTIEPKPMRSTGLKYSADGRVAWDEIWGSFCDLAMAGGPPHKGSLLEPATAADVDAQPERYREVTEEICRGIAMASELAAGDSPNPGWIRVRCFSDVMAAWLLRAIVMENVSARAEGTYLNLPASPHFRLDKEIKNVVTVIAKTSHYWMGHIPREQKSAIGDLFATLSRTSPLLVPDQGWLGVEIPTERRAIWMMRALVASNILSRREGLVLFVPINNEADPHGERVSETLDRIHRLAIAGHSA